METKKVNFELGTSYLPVVSVLRKSNLFGSISDAKRLVGDKKVSVNGEVTEDWNFQVKVGDKIEIMEPNDLIEIMVK